MLAEVCGIGMTADSKTIVGGDIDGAREAMRLALRDAGLEPSDIDYLNAHGAATIVGDRNETHAIKQTFGITASLQGGHAGVFDVALDDRVVYSKDQTFRFPTHEEIFAQIRAHQKG